MGSWGDWEWVACPECEGHGGWNEPKTHVNTQEENIEFRKEWDNRYEAGLKKENDK